MADLGINFDPNAHAQMSEGASVLSHEGWMQAQIIASETKPTKANDGGFYLAVTWQVLDGPDKNGQVKSILNIGNKNEVAQRIAYEELATICFAANYMKPLTKSEVLHKKPMLVKMVCKADPGYQPKTEAKGYKVLGSQVPELKLAVIPEAAPAAAAPGAAGGFAAPAIPAVTSGGFAPPSFTAPAAATAAAAPAAAAPAFNPATAPTQPWTAAGADSTVAAAATAAAAVTQAPAAKPTTVPEFLAQFPTATPEQIGAFAAALAAEQAAAAAAVPQDVAAPVAPAAAAEPVVPVTAPAVGAATVPSWQ